MGAVDKSDALHSVIISLLHLYLLLSIFRYYHIAGFQFLLKKESLLRYFYCTSDLNSVSV